MSAISLGLMGSTSPKLLRALAPRLEDAGFRGLWLNDPSRGDPFQGVAAAASVTSTLRLGIGVLPLDRRPADAILRSVSANDLPLDRLVVGVGAGGSRSLAKVAEGVQVLRDAGCTTSVGALGPRMRDLGARSAGHLLLNWLTPALAAEARQEAAHAAAAAERPGCEVALYVRTALDPDALPLLEEEARRYAAIPSYAANFGRHGISPIDTTIADRGTGIADRLDDYLRSVDEVVLRAVTPHSTLEDILRFVGHPDIARRLQAS